MWTTGEKGCNRRGHGTHSMRVRRWELGGATLLVEESVGMESRSAHSPAVAPDGWSCPDKGPLCS